MPAAIARRGTSENNLLSAFGCSLCGLCDAACPEGLSPSTMFLAMRQEAQKLGLVDLKAYTPWLNYEHLGGSTLFQRDLIPKNCSSVFFPGCSLPGSRPQAVHELFTRLKTLDPTTGLVLDCCGKISHDLGLADRFQQIFNKLADRLQNRGITRILTACPGCSKILQKYGAGLEVISVYEILASSPLPHTPCPLPLAPVVIHDPCPARFDTAQQQAVRRLVSSCGYSFEEMPEHGRTTRCCGQGGMVEGCVPGTVKRESAIIAAEAVGRRVISSCGACCETMTATTPTAHVADLLVGNTVFSDRPVSSARRWINRLKLKFARV
jgi:Fe-S oxidoreductase